MNETKNNRSRFVGLRFKPDEFDKLELRMKGTTTPEISEFIRRILFDKPITVYQRNHSLDEFIQEMILLRKELNSIGNNFNQAVRKLHTLDQVAEFKSWVIRYEGEKQFLLNKVELIQQKIDTISDEWLQ
jgi:hypothetical protein